MKGKRGFCEGETTASLFIHGDLCGTTIRMWSKFTDTAVFLPRQNLPLGAPVTETGSKKLILKKTKTKQLQ